MIFDSDQDFGPFETLFDAYCTYRVKLTIGAEVFDCDVDSAGRDHVVVRPYDENDATGDTRTVPYSDIDELLVY